MKSRTFNSAIWADSWEKIRQSEAECEQGIASFDEDGGIRLEIPFGEILRDSGGLVLDDRKLPGELDWLYGFAQDGHRIVLSDVMSLGTSRSFPGGSRQTLGAARLLFAKNEFDPEGPVSGVTLKINGIAQWLGMSPINTRTRFKDGRVTGFEVGADFGDESCNAVLLDDEAFFIRVYHSVSTSGDAAIGLDIGHRCILEARFKNSLTLPDAEEIAFRLADFFSFCFGFNAEIDEMSLAFQGGTTAGYLVPLVKGRAPRDILSSRMPLRFQELEGGVAEVLGAWLSDDELKTPSLLLVSLLTKEWRLPMELKFIAAAQMLESLCRVGADLEAMDRDEFRAYESAVKSALEGIEDGHIRAMAKEKIRVSNSKGQRRLLSELLERHREAASFLFGDPKAFCRRHIELRNDITHRNGGHRSGAEALYVHTESVLLLAYCAVGELMGLPAEILAQRLGDSRFKAGVVHRCREMYPAKGAKSEPSDVDN